MADDAPLYVVVCQNDKPHPRWGVDEGGPLVHEQYTRTATLENMRKRAATMEQHGACRVARLVFEDHPAFGEPAARAGRSTRCPHGVSELNRCERCD